MARTPVLELESEVGLADAVEEGDTLLLDGLPGFFELHYQPEIDLRTDAVTGVEALLRWWHPDYGVMSPGAALHHTKWAEHLIGLDRWAVHAACRQLARWNAGGGSLRVALNVTPGSLTDPEFRRTVGDALVASGAQPERLGIDVPLSAFTVQPFATQQTTTTLANFGITVIADGVTGDSCREALERFPISVVKVPVTASLKQHDRVHPSVESALEVARRLGAVSVAKAVESAAHLRAVRQLGYQRAFGFHISDPLSADGIDALIATL